MDTGLALTRFSALAAFLAYAAAIWPRCRPTGGFSPAARQFWMVGSVLMALHTACAFHFVHYWSHRSAYESTARQTAELTGLAVGGGLYANDAMLALWLADALWLWLAPESRARRPRWIDRVLHTFMAFMWINATVVFGHGWGRWIGGLTIGLLLVQWIRVGRRQSGKDHD